MLVDLTPEALQQRLLAGKVYRADRVETALQNFFRIDNLSALRELVLRELAEDVEAKRHTPCSTRSASRQSPSGSSCS